MGSRGFAFQAILIMFGFTSRDVYQPCYPIYVE